MKDCQKCISITEPNTALYAAGSLKFALWLGTARAQKQKYSQLYKVSDLVNDYHPLCYDLSRVCCLTYMVFQYYCDYLKNLTCTIVNLIHLANAKFCLQLNIRSKRIQNELLGTFLSLFFFLQSEMQSNFVLKIFLFIINCNI